MTGFLVLRDKIVNFYNEHGIFVNPVIKFIIFFTGIMLIRSHIGYMAMLDQPLILLLIAVVLSFVPWGIIVAAFVGVIIANLYALTLEMAVVVLVLMLIMFLLYFRFAPQYGIFVLLVPIAFYLKVPYVIPIAAGLVCTPVSAVSIVFGTIIYFILDVVERNSAAISNITSDETSTAGINTIITMMTSNKEMMLTIVVFVVAVIVVYVIKRMSIDNSWMKAIVVGSGVEFAMLLVGNLMLDTQSSIIWLIVGTVLSILIAMILQFFVFSVDYSRVEHTQFEDDEYYYYVKAVPKINVSEPEMNVKRINAQRHHINEHVKNKKKLQ